MFNVCREARGYTFGVMRGRKMINIYMGKKTASATHCHVYNCLTQPNTRWVFRFLSVSSFKTISPK